jgi:hypothetical protein
MCRMPFRDELGTAATILACRAPSEQIRIVCHALFGLVLA